MAGKYYHSTPLGAGLSNLTEAISGLPEREAKVGLLAQQRLASESQARAQDAHASLYAAQAEDQQAQMAGQAALAQSVQDFILNGGAAPGGVASAVAPSGPVPSANVAGVGQVPGAAPTPPVPPPGQGITMAMNLPPPTMPAMPPAGGAMGGSGLAGALGVGAPPVAPVAPVAPPAGPMDTGTGMPSLASSIAPVIEQFQKLPPKTQQELFAAVMGNSVRAGHQFMREQPKFNLGIAGGMNATAPEGQQPYNKARMTDWQTGAGESYQNTGLGAGDVLTQKADEAAAKDKTMNRKIDVESADTRRGQDVHAATSRANASGRAGGAAVKPLTTTEWGHVRKAFKESRGPGMEASGAQMEAMEKRFMELVRDGVRKGDAVQQVTEEAWGDVETKGEGKGWFGSNFMKPDDKVERKFQLRTPNPIDSEVYKSLQAGEAPPPTGKPEPIKGKGKTTTAPTDLIPKDKKGNVDVSALRGQAQQALEAGKDRKAVEAAFHKATGMHL